MAAVASSALEAARATAASFAGYALTSAQNEALLGAFDELLCAFSTLESAELLQRLSGRLDAAGFAELSRHCGGVPVFGAAELRRLLAYADFAQQVLLEPAPLTIRVRVEGWKAYVLQPLPGGLIRNVDIRSSLLWTHDEAWARDRFFDGGSNLGLCGQFMERSKFVTPCVEFPGSKAAALDALGLRGYPEFDKPGTLYVVRAEMNANILEKAQPSVPLLYQVAEASSPEASAPERWKPCMHFQEGTIPGFTSGLMAELVVNTFQVDASSAAELAELGVCCTGLKDEYVPSQDCG